MLTAAPGPTPRRRGMSLCSEGFGVAPNGSPLRRCHLRSRSGCEAEVLSWGATLASLRVPAKDGHVVLGFDDPRAYLQDRSYFGATVGRFANRIRGASFELDQHIYTLSQNEGRQHLHGGSGGFSRRNWAVIGGSEDRVCLRLMSAHGEEGYPGRVEATVCYRLLDPGALRIDFRATVDRPTVLNLTHHSYFNLGDAGASSVLDHELWLCADAYTPVDPEGVPVGEMAPVEGTPFDFRSPRRLGEHIEALDAERGGYDHNFVLGGGTSPCPRPVARLVEVRSGRTLTVHTTQPGLQLYTSNHLDGSGVGRGGVAYARHCAVCLETQHFPDSPHHPSFPTTRVLPTQDYRHTTIYALTW